MLKIEVNFDSEYGVMFLHDSNIEPLIPKDIGTAPITKTSTCLAFSVLNYVDGSAKVIICDSPTDSALEHYFQGEIECDSKSLSLTDSNGFPFVSVPLNDCMARISIRMSKKNNADLVECVIENVAVF